MKVKKSLKRLLAGSLVCMFTVTTAFGAATSYTPATKINGLSTQYVTLDMNQNITPIMLTAGNNLCSADSVTNMAKAKGCVAAINGTYFSAYDGNPIPWGTIIKNGELIHTGSGAVGGFTSDGKFIIDRLKFEIKGYVNGVYRSIPWRVNHPSTEGTAITLFTPAYGTTVKVMPGAKAPVVGADGKVQYIATSNFTVPAGGFAFLYNADVAYLVDQRFKVGDTVTYEINYKTTFTTPEQWDDVVQAVGAGPSLIINGQITADGPAEGFTEAKITTNKAGRTFIGADKNGVVRMGSISNATIKEAAAICQSLGLVNAMCLDGGGSIGLYYDGKTIAAGRQVNNALGFIGAPAVPTIKPAKANVQIDGVPVEFEAYNIGGNNYFKLRDFSMAVTNSHKHFDVTWDGEKQAINLISGRSYTKVGGELQKGDGKAKPYSPTTAKIYKDGKEIKLTAYTIGGNNYFKLRDMAKAFDFGVGYDEATTLISIDSNKSYVD